MTTDEPKPVSWQQQQAYLGTVCDPRLFGLSLVDSPKGVRIQGGGRLHYSQSYALEMGMEEPLRSVIDLQGRMGETWAVLLDFTAKNSLFEFDMGQALGARPVAEGRPTMMTLPGDDVASCVSVIPTMRLGQIFVEHPLVLVRMDNGLPGGYDRGIVEPRLRGVVGWDILRKLEQVQLLYSMEQVVLKSTDGYEPNPYELVAQVPLDTSLRVCAVPGTVRGATVSVLIDPAGDFEVATPQGLPIASLVLADGLSFENPSVAVSPDSNVRIGARLLEQYRVTICPKQKVMYFESRATDD